MKSTTSKKLRVLALMMALVMVMPCFAGFGAIAADAYTLTPEEEMAAISALETPALLVYYELMDLWVDDNGDLVYPDAFGGSYLNDDYKLAIKLVNENATLRAWIENSVSDPSVIVFENTDISLNELLGLFEDAPQSLGSSYNVKEVSVIQKDSCVEVAVLPNGDEVAEYNLRGLDPHIRIVEYGEIETITQKISFASANDGVGVGLANGTDEVGLIPGGMFCNSDDSSDPVFEDPGKMATLGWFGRYSFNGEEIDCLLLAGHSGYNTRYRRYGLTAPQDGRNDSVGVQGKEHIEFVPYTMFQSDSTYYHSFVEPLTGYDYISSGDYSFVAYDTDVLQPTDTIKISESRQIRMSGYVGTSPVCEDQTVYKGMGITGYRAGTVTASFCSQEVSEVFYDGSFDDGETVYIYDLVAVSANDGGAFSDEGDSGCPVYIQLGSIYSLCGIISGGGTVSRFTPMCTIRDAGFIPYPFYLG